MKIILTAIDARLAAAWSKFCADIDCVVVHQGSILDVQCDAVVSPVNSFGFMDGGVDALYFEHFGSQIEEQVRLAILNRHYGELLVGQADIVETGRASPPFLIAGPTMRVPMALGRETINPYLATRAVLRLATHGLFADGPFAGQRISDHVRVLAFPGMGTGVGRVSAEVCAKQVRTAIVEHLEGRISLPSSWAEASERHQLLYTDRPTRLQY
ncbi:MAG: macro domain-containing protein [Reyranella sp.]|uniref:macro domain-containing protein n=1 Tax=Reyranella sp. TaxID=1929291 RepID=UPI001ACB1C64|nr:macro domain-containing protein [Reyranella sp.]MBN9088432.1 macro domain-containing protein [Reyranella sp.]